MGGELNSYVAIFMLVAVIVGGIPFSKWRERTLDRLEGKYAKYLDKKLEGRIITVDPELSKLVEKVMAERAQQKNDS